MDTKKCKKCGEIKALSEYGNRGKRVDGSLKIRLDCKPCESARIRAVAERGKRDQRLTFVREIEGQDNVTSWLRKSLFSCSCGGERVTYRHSVRNGLTSSCGCKGKEAAEVTLATHGESGHPLYHKSMSANSKAKRLGVEGFILPSGIQQLFDNHGWCCYYCGLQSTDHGVMTLDHFVPYALGGSNTIQNCVPACTCCNSAKCDRDPKEFIESKRKGKKD